MVSQNAVQDGDASEQADVRHYAPFVESNEVRRTTGVLLRMGARTLLL